MTFDERVQALAYLGFTPRQTRFLVTVALHSGYCVRRQFAAFAGVEYGKNVRSFLDQLVERQLGRRLQFEINRGHVYHVSARSVYRAIGQDDNRNRRTAAPALIARKLMLLDFALAQPADEWLATEQDKVAFFSDHSLIALAHLPRRVYVSSDRRKEPPARYFIDKLPIFLAGEPQTVHFVFLATESGVQPFARFLWDHCALFTRLPRWAVVVVCPQYTADLRTFQAAFDEFRNGSLKAKTVASRDDVRWYFTTRRSVEQDDLPTVSVMLIDRFHAARRRFSGALFESLYADWLAHGGSVLDRIEHPRLPISTKGTLLTRELPFSYVQFGKLPGVA
jgi:hypothetical protein